MKVSIHLTNCRTGQSRVVQEIRSLFEHFFSSNSQQKYQSVYVSKGRMTFFEGVHSLVTQAKRLHAQWNTRLGSVFCLSRKEIISMVLGTSQGGFHPRVGARCYLLNKSVLNKLDLEDLYCVVIGVQKTFLKIFKDHCEILRCLIKFGTILTLFSNKIFEAQLSVAQENISTVHQPPKIPAFGSLTVWSRNTLTIENLFNYVF